MLAVLVLAGIVGYSLVQGLGDDQRGPTDDPSAWNAIAAVDPEDGVVTVFDLDGGELERIETGLDEPQLRTISNRQLAVVGDGTAAIVDLGVPTVARIAIPDGLDLLVTRRGAPRAFLGTLTGGPVLVPIEDGELVDVAADAGWDDPLILPERAVATPSGRHLAVDNADRDPESAVISTEDGDVVVVAGLIVTLDDDGITTQRSDDDVTVLERFDLDGASQGSVELAVRPAAALVGDDGTLIAITPEGGLVRIDTAAGASEEIGQLDVDQTVERAFAVPPSGEAALVIDELDDDRAAVYVVRPDGSSSGPTELSASLTRVEMGTADGCIAVSGQDAATVLDVSDAKIVGEVESDDPIGGFQASADACTVVVFDREQRQVITPEGVVELDGGRAVAVSPDGAWVAVRTEPGGDEAPAMLATPIEALDDGAIDPDMAIELPSRAHVVFVEHG